MLETEATWGGGIQSGIGPVSSPQPDHLNEVQVIRVQTDRRIKFTPTLQMGGLHATRLEYIQTGFGPGLKNYRLPFTMKEAGFFSSWYMQAGRPFQSIQVGNPWDPQRFIGIRRIWLNRAK